MKGLRKIIPLMLPDLKPKVIPGNKPELLWAPPTSLLVDATYQRDLSERSMRLIRKVIDGFAWNRMKPPIVVRVDGGLHVVDGQHTAIAAATLGIPEIPVFVVEAETEDERARAFVGHNTDRVAVSAFDIFRALVASGDPGAVAVAAVCKAAKVRIRQISPSSHIEVGDTSAISTLRKMVKKRGHDDAVQVLEILVMAKRAPIGQAELLAADEMLCGEPRVRLDAVTLARVIRIDGDEGLAKAHARAKLEKKPAWEAVVSRWIKLYHEAAGT